MTPLQESDGVPRKAYRVRYAIVNEMEAIVYAESLPDALRRFEGGEGHVENMSADWRLRKPTAKRWPQEDR